MRWSRSKLVASLILLAAPGCGGQSPPPAAAASPAASAKPDASASASPVASSAASAAPVASGKPSPSAAPAAAAPPAEIKRPAHPHTLPDVFIAALGAVELKPEQKTAILAIQADLDKSRQAPRTAYQTLVGDLADGVTAGKLDESKIDVDMGALRESVRETAPDMQSAMNRLHQTLDPDQRKKLVEALRERAKTLRQKEELGPTGMGPGVREERLKALEQELALSPEQAQKLHEKLDPQLKAQAAALKEKLATLSTQLNLLAEAFASDKFDAKQVGVGAYAPDLLVAIGKNRLEYVKTLLPVLTPVQCTLFAKDLRAHAGLPGDDTSSS
jgi:Spy/CpxP family protein refolding chaperone